MIKLHSTLHDPLQIYDYFKNNYGSIYILVQKNTIIIKFQNIHIADQLLKNHNIIKIKGLPLKIYPIDYDINQKKQKLLLSDSFNDDINILIEENNHNLANKLNNTNNMGNSSNNNNSNNNNNNNNNNNMQIQPQPLMDEYTSIIEQKSHLIHTIGIKLKKLNNIYEQKICQIKQLYRDEQICNKKISQFNKYYNKQLKINKKILLNPFNLLINKIRQYNHNRQDQPIELQPNFYYDNGINSNINSNNRIINNIDNNSNEILSPKFTEKLIYANPQNNQIKRIYALNDTDFITTQKSTKSDSKGYLKMYRKQQSASKYCIQIQQCPYSLLCLDNYILTGDHYGYIHFIDIENNNQIEYSNRLNAGLIYQMQRYPLLQQSPSQSYRILTLLMGKDDYRIKQFSIEKQSINDNVNSLTFHSGNQIKCEGITMTMDVIGNQGRFMYGSQKKTYICDGFGVGKYGNIKKSVIEHDYNVMKVKKFNKKYSNQSSNNRIIQVTLRKLYLTDINNRKFQKEFSSKFDLNTVQKLNDNLVFYGGRNGQIGVVDWRNTKQSVWSVQDDIHKGKISDILKIGDRVITADSTGIICEWKNQQVI